MKYRWFVYSFTLALVLFLLANLVVWKTCTEKLFSFNYGEGGDLARLGYLPAFKLQRKSPNNLPLRHISLREYVGQPVDMLTVGDSFSNGGGSGENRYYQDFIATYNRMSVLNVGRYKGGGSTLDPASTLLLLINSGEFDKINPRTVFLSVSVKQIVELLAPPLDLAMTVPIEKVQDSRNYVWYDGGPAPSTLLDFLSSGNFKYLYHTVRQRYFHKTNEKAATAPLTKKLFSVEGNTLLYYRGDVQKIASNSAQALNQINDNLNKVADLLAKRGVKLYFMPCVDKYDLYSPYIPDNKLPKNTFFEMFRPLPKRYSFVDTKEILSAAVAEGVQDVFFPDDTHWSSKASERIFQNVKFR
jgi:hypothetical protein